MYVVGIDAKANTNLTLHRAPLSAVFYLHIYSIPH
jgi:hypothetical protein